MRWANEWRWDPIIKAKASIHGVPFTLIQAVIGQESQFNPAAYRGEVRLQDGSIGLMQILYSTARSMGYSGPVGNAQDLTGLYEPATNLEYGTRYLSQQYNRAGQDPAGAVSAYNGGWRPELGFGRPATKAVRLCLARDQKTGECTRWRDVKSGEYGNKPHVDAVMDNLEYFEQKRRAASPIGAITSPVTETGSTNPKTVAALVGLLLTLLAVRWGRKKRG
jgi:hypothetical protein